MKKAVNFIGSFETELAKEARRRHVDGVICGHVHHPNVRLIDGVIYVNTGDFVESCSYAVERETGAIEVKLWPAWREAAKAIPAVQGVLENAPEFEAA